MNKERSILKYSLFLVANCRNGCCGVVSLEVVMDVVVMESMMWMVEIYRVLV